MAMLGAGDTARAAVPVMAQAFNLKEIRVTSRTPESRQNYAREISQEYGLNVSRWNPPKQRSKARMSSSQQPPHRRHS